MENINNIRIDVNNSVLGNNNSNDMTNQIINSNSPKIIQQIIHLDSSHNKIEIMKQNKISEKIISINSQIQQAIDSNIEDNNFNPIIQSKKQKNNLYKLNFNNNFNQKELDTKIQQYEELGQKVIKYKTKLQNNSINNGSKIKNDLNEELFIAYHPLAPLYEKDLNINKLKNNLIKIKKNDNNNITIGTILNNDDIEYKILVEEGPSTVNNINNNISMAETSDNDSNIEYSSQNSNDDDSIISQNDE